jgi:hypothetical protein
MEIHVGNMHTLKKVVCCIRIRLITGRLVILSFFQFRLTARKISILVKNIYPSENGSILITRTQIESGIGPLVFGRITNRPVINRIRMQQTTFFSGERITNHKWQKTNQEWNRKLMMHGMVQQYQTILAPLTDHDIICQSQLSDHRSLVKWKYT